MFDSDLAGTGVLFDSDLVGTDVLFELNSYGLDTRESLMKVQDNGQVLVPVQNTDGGGWRKA